MIDDKQMQTFDDAKGATENLFDDGEQLSIEGVENSEQQTAEETSTNTDNPTTENIDPVTETAVQTAEIAAQTANEKDQHLQQVLQELSAIKEENNSLKQMVSEINNQNKEQLIEDVMPVLDIGSLAFDDEDTIKGKQADYAKQMAEYVKKSLMQELSPFVEQAKEGMYQKEKSEVISALSTIPQYRDWDWGNVATA